MTDEDVIAAGHGKVPDLTAYMVNSVAELFSAGLAPCTWVQWSNLNDTLEGLWGTDGKELRRAAAAVQLLVETNEVTHGRFKTGAFRPWMRSRVETRTFPTPLQDWIRDLDTRVSTVVAQNPPLTRQAVDVMVEAACASATAALYGAPLAPSHVGWDDERAEIVGAWPRLDEDGHHEIINSPWWWQQVWVEQSSADNSYAIPLFLEHHVTWRIAMRRVRGFAEWWDRNYRQVQQRHSSAQGRSTTSDEPSHGSAHPPALRAGSYVGLDPGNWRTPMPNVNRGIFESNPALNQGQIYNNNITPYSSA